MNVNQTTQSIEKYHFCSFNTDYTVKTMPCYFTSDYYISDPEYC